MNAEAIKLGTSPRTRELFEEHLTSIRKHTDRLFAGLMIFQWLAGIGFAFWLSPKTWTGSTSSIHPHVVLAVFFGGIITALPVFLALTRSGSVLSRHVVTVGQVLMSALLIHLLGGRIETHFHVFGSLAFLAFYRDWKLLVSASAIVAADHLLRGIYMPLSVYGEITGATWRWLEHAGWVVFLDIFLFIGTAISIREMQVKAERQAELELANETITQARHEVEEKTRLLDSILENMGEGVVVCDNEGRFILFNPAAEKILGQTAVDVQPDQWSEAYGVYKEDGVTPYPPEFLPLARAMRGEAVDCEELRIKRSNSKDLIWTEISGRPLIDADGVSGGGMVVLREITERKRLMEGMQKAQANAERANQAKSEFLSRMSHELRTPLNSVIGFAQLMELEDLTPTFGNYVQRVQQAGHHLLGLINEVLDIARIEAGKLSLSKEAVNLSDVVEQSVALLSPTAAQRGIKLRTENCHSLVYVRADRQRLSQVLLNLLSNAIKFNRDNGEVVVSVTETSRRVLITVADTGHGIADDQVHKLFLPFERLGADKREVEGTGLGLALSKGLAEAMDGSLYLKGNSTAGTTFELTLESMEAPVSMPKEMPPERDLLVRRCNANVLLVEDNPANINLMQGIFKLVPGAKLHVAENAAKGVKMASSLKPDLILLDLHLPDQPGSWVLECVRGTPGCERVPILVVSADATETERQRLLDLGALAYIVKPFRVPELLAVVEGILEPRAAKAA